MRSGKETTSSTTSISITRDLSPVDSTIPYRFVGSWEYGKCLDSFNQLVNISTDEEISVYDEFLNDRPEFTYYQGANTAFQEQPDLTKLKPKERSRFNDRFQKGGLAWMIALAQVEVAATISMYTDAENPFAEIVDSEFGNEEYLQLLIDDVTAHMKSLEGEKLYRKMFDGERRIDTWTIAYLRRLKVIKNLQIAISGSASSDVVEELRPYYAALDKQERALVKIVDAWLTDINYEYDGKTSVRDVSKAGIPTSLIDDCAANIGEYVEGGRATSTSGTRFLKPSIQVPEKR